MLNMGYSIHLLLLGGHIVQLKAFAPQISNCKDTSQRVVLRNGINSNCFLYQYGKLHPQPNGHPAALGRFFLGLRLAVVFFDSLQAIINRF